MIFSMTAFARQQLDQAWGSLAWEIRSVNHRYLESSIRLPESLRGLETPVREMLRDRLSRGKVECQLRYQPGPRQQDQLPVDVEMVARLNEATDTVLQIASDAAPMSVAEILRWPGVIQEREADSSALEQQALEVFGKALDELVEARKREGAELGRLISQRLQAITEIVARVRQIMPGILARQREAILRRLSELQLELEPARLEQELVLLAQKSDVDEELDRLSSHVGEVARILRSEGQKGRRLDFLMQELNREANTLSSKSIVTETTLDAVELKVLIEQMREQIQNIE